MIDLSLTISIINWNVNGLNIQIKGRDCQIGYKIKNQLYAAYKYRSSSTHFGVMSQ